MFQPIQCQPIRSTWRFSVTSAEYVQAPHAASCFGDHAESSAEVFGASCMRGVRVRVVGQAWCGFHLRRELCFGHRRIQT